MTGSWLSQHPSYQYVCDLEEEIDNTFKEIGYSLEDVRRLINEGRMEIYTGTNLERLYKVYSAWLDGHELFQIVMEYWGNKPHFIKTVGEK